MAARADEVGYDRLHYFIGAGDLGQRAAGSNIVAVVDALIGGDTAQLIIDDTALPKKGGFDWDRAKICFGTDRNRQSSFQQSDIVM
ncbi:hypothetical protein [Sphingosinicella microcystinivorans]|uniref:hypothetical protein n=1 Tax=Sphingosinicella microcystinivorans TaxID=335406 RepID=UPI003B684DC5